MIPGDDRPFLVDVSWCQGASIDWKRTHDEGGVDVAIMKATEGVFGTDPTLARNLEAASAAGILTAEYHFARASQGNPEAEVEHFWNALGGKLPSFVAFDLESCPANMTPAEVVAYGERWITAARRYFGGIPIVTYSFDWFIVHQLATHSAIFASTPLWIASPTWNKPGLPPKTMRPPVHAPWTDWLIHQFASDGSKGVPGTLVPGIPSVVDRNVFNGTIDDLHKFFGRPDPDVDPDSTRIVHPIPDLSGALPDDAA